ncbi:phosphoglycerate dehydrogenase [Pullulanibacillus sp. KACC 23026]|uniref:phosphoglycerate dehydrogenase n=1 Tax=Pullulanibacillus sp. KACC 23026 TaxID=3028315 RepID=UPI0023B1526B|nr:phosphoglycerate dehydrogenase [Pullulanibacillus sp. KACC 23026]WEG12118.1 phosphoglycerate dehydrogenase [Pullulanibacillus sp. KACC 23026]
MSTSTLEKKTLGQIKVLNKISEKGLKVFKEQYEVSNVSQNPDGILVRSHEMHTMEFGTHLKAIARAGAGVNNIPVQLCTDKGIVVFNTPGANANAVKELVLASLINASRNLYEAVTWTQNLTGDGHELAKQVEEGKKQFVGTELEGKTLGVIGLGAIGALVANNALNLGMDVVGFDPFISVDLAWNLSRDVGRAMSIDQLFEEADYITVHVPLNDQTRDMFNEEAFNKMKPGVTILNFSRGELVNETDLAVVLESGKVNKYVTDFPNEHVLNMKHAFATPHLGASTIESEENCAVMASRQLKEFLETGNIKNSVNFPNVTLPYTGKRRITVFHDNIPNMVSHITAILAAYQFNITDMVNKNRGTIAYTLIDIDNELNGATVQELEGEINQIQGIIRTRII